jgi:hypothetical protein
MKVRFEQAKSSGDVLSSAQFPWECTAATSDKAIPPWNGREPKLDCGLNEWTGLCVPRAEVALLSAIQGDEDGSKTCRAILPAKKSLCAANESTASVGEELAVVKDSAVGTAKNKAICVQSSVPGETCVAATNVGSDALNCQPKKRLALLIKPEETVLGRAAAAICGGIAYSDCDGEKVKFNWGAGDRIFCHQTLAFCVPNLSSDLGHVADVAAVTCGKAHSKVPEIVANVGAGKFENGITVKQCEEQFVEAKEPVVTEGRINGSGGASFKVSAGMKVKSRGLCELTGVP